MSDSCFCPLLRQFQDWDCADFDFPQCAPFADKRLVKPLPIQFGLIRQRGVICA